MSDEQPTAGRPRRRLPIDLRELDSAFEESLGAASWYLDLETSRLVRIDEETRSELEKIHQSADEEIEPAELVRLVKASDIPGWQQELVIQADEVESGLGDRYVAVPVVDTAEDYRDMEEFIDTVQSERLRDRLYRAISGRVAFRYFRDTLLDAPRERERWFEYKAQHVRARALEWLESEGIEPIRSEQ